MIKKAVGVLIHAVCVEGKRNRDTERYRSRREDGRETEVVRMGDEYKYTCAKFKEQMSWEEYR